MKTNNRYTQLGNIRGILRLVKTATCTATCTTALLLAAACSNELPQESGAINNGNGNQGTPITLTANVPTGGGADTRISLDDQGTSGVKLAWTQGDAFKLYTKETDTMFRAAEAGLFTLTAIGTDSQQATFSGMLTAEPASASDGYTAYYPASKFSVSKNSQKEIDLTGQVQDGNNTITHLADYNLMIATGIKDLTQPITFTPMMTMLTFKLTMPADMKGAPIELKLKTDGYDDFMEKMLILDAYSNEFRLGLKNITLSDDRLLTAHMLVYCYDLTGKELSTIVSTSTGEVYTYTATVTKKYEKGKRYTATIAANDWTKTTSPGLFDNSVVASEGTAPKADNSNYPGSYNNPYLIASADDLQYLVKNPSTTTDYYYKLTTDIFVTADKWTPIGNYNNPFQMKGFDGDGHSINGVLKMGETSDSNSFHYGFFGYVQANSSDPTIKNLNVNADVNIDASTYTGTSKEASIYVGGIAGYISSSSTNSCSIENCSFNGEMTVANLIADTAAPSFYVGGIVGCSTKGGTYANSLSDCTNTGIINSPTIGNTEGILYIGGILGKISTSGIELHTCLNAGTVNITEQSLGKIHCGGLSGNNFNNTTNIIYDCCNHTGILNVKGTPASPNKWTDDDDNPNWMPKACSRNHSQR